MDIHATAGHVPSLMSLCVNTIKRAILSGYEDLHNILELPSNLLDCLVSQLSPLALENLSITEFRCHKNGFSNNSEAGKKRKRCIDLNEVWKTLFMSRWPDHGKTTNEHHLVTNIDGRGLCESDDWQQLYWERHLQMCLDDASETVMLPIFKGYVGEVIISDAIIESIGCKDDISFEIPDHRRLSYHCKKFGHYARRLRLHNVLCVSETCKLLRSSNLQDLLFCNIKSKSHVDGVCHLIKQNRDTILALSFTYCNLSTTALDDICASISKEGSEHVIQCLSFMSSSIFGNTSAPASLSGFLSFLTYERSLFSIKFCETRMGPVPAKLIFDALHHSSSGLSTFEISDNNISGWLAKDLGSKFLSYELDTPLKSLHVLNLRGNDLNMNDANDLKSALAHMPKLSSLDIGDNPLEDEGIRNLLPYFCKSPLTTVKVDNCDLSSSGVAQLLIALSSSNQQLNCLSIAENNLGRSIALPLSKFLKASSIRDLNIEDIGLDSLGFQDLEDNLPKISELCYLNISKNRGGISAARFISKVLLHAPELRTVKAGYNLMPLKSVEVLCDALEHFKGKLRELDLTGNRHLCRLSHETSLFTNFCFQGTPIIILPLVPSSAEPYDDEP